MESLDQGSSIDIETFGRGFRENVRQRSSKWSRHAFDVGDSFLAEVVEASGGPSSEIGITKLGFSDCNVVRDPSKTEVGVCAQDLVDQTVPL